MIKVINYQNESFEKTLETHISNCYDEFRKLFPTAPETIEIYFGTAFIMDETGVGAHAYSSEIITLSFDPDFKDKEKQIADIRPSIFHECFHQYQDFTSASPPYSAIEGAIYEGMATVFERDYADSTHSYGDYRQVSEEDLETWAGELEDLGNEYHEDEEIWRAWKFYHPVHKERWISYRVGTWITDKVMEKYGLDIFKLSEMTAKDVLRLFKK